MNDEYSEVSVSLCRNSRCPILLTNPIAQLVSDLSALVQFEEDRYIAMCSRRSADRKAKKLNLANRVVESNPEILGGTPVFRGTRVPVHLVANMLEQGASPEEILEGYPTLTHEMIDQARVYEAGHQQRNRSGAQPWSGRKPLREKQAKLVDLT